MALGLISAPGFFADAQTRAAWCGAKWAGDGPGAIDPEKEAKGAQARMDAGLTTLPEEIVAYDGGSWEQKHSEQERVNKARRKAGLVQDMPGQAPPPGAAQPQRDDEQLDDDQADPGR